RKYNAKTAVKLVYFK
ncbi:hypothetical protein, partial [Escherichia coli]